MDFDVCYLHKNRKRVLNFIREYDHVYLYGAGLVAECFYRYLEEEKIHISGVIVSVSAEEELFHGIKIMSINDVIPNENFGIILAMDRNNQNIVKPLLIAKGFKECQLYKQNEFFVQSNVALNTECILNDMHIGNDGYFAKYTYLNELGLKHGTDKASTVHNYLCKYEHFLRDRKNIKLLELGVLNGSSLKMWSEYYPDGEVYGVDIMPKCQAFTGENRKVITEDLSDKIALERIASIEPDVIIDDASHWWSHQIKALFVLFPALSPGGLYILEDLETNFRLYSHKGFDDATLSAYEVLEALNEILTSGETFCIGQKNAILLHYKEILESIAMDIEMMSFIHGSCIIMKKG